MVSVHGQENGEGTPKLVSELAPRKNRKKKEGLVNEAWWKCTLGNSLVPKPSPAPVSFDCLQYAKTEGEGLVNLIT